MTFEIKQLVILKGRLKIDKVDHDQMLFPNKTILLALTFSRIYFVNLNWHNCTCFGFMMKHTLLISFVVYQRVAISPPNGMSGT